MQVVDARAYRAGDSVDLAADEAQIQVHQRRQEKMDVQPRNMSKRHDGRYGEVDLGHELAVEHDGARAGEDAVLHEEPRDKAHQHEQKARIGSDVDVAYADVVALAGGSEADFEREPVYEKGEQRLDRGPERAYDRALIFFYELVLGQKQYLLAEALVLLYYLKHPYAPFTPIAAVPRDPTRAFARDDTVKKLPINRFILHILIQYILSIILYNNIDNCQYFMYADYRFEEVMICAGFFLLYFGIFIDKRAL